MKKITYLFVLLVTLLTVSQGFSQKAVVIGTTHSGTDSFSFLVTQPIANGEFVYFSEDEYNNATNVFSGGESVVRFTAGSALTVGTVVRVQEGASNVLTVTCTGGGSCGTATVLTSFFSLRTDGEAYYSYSDTDGDPTNGVTEIYSVFYTGESGQATGGPIPAALDPTPDYPNSIVVDGFPAVSPNRAEYQFAAAGIRDGLCRTDLENVSNYLHAQAFQALSTTIFNSFTLSCSSPTLTVTRTPASVAENSGSPITYTFTLGVAAPSPITVNFSVGGTASFPSDYGQSGAATFGASSGTVVIGTGTTTANVTITPSGDTTLEPDETVILTATAGTGYTVGSPSSGTATITNDDTQNITPVVAVTGLNNAVAPGIEGFSFVALDDIAAGIEVFFTEEEFNRNTLAFSTTSGEGVVRWTAPAGGVLRGEVIVATENSPDTFTATCNSGTCGSFTTIVTGFTFASNGEGFFAYSDSDTDPTNGVTQVHSVLYTGNNSTPGGNIPAIEDPSSVYVGSVVVDGFPAVQPQRTEYNPALRGVTVDQANFQNTANWLHAQSPATLDTTPFANIIIVTGSANPTLTLAVAPTTTVEDSGVGMVYTFTLSAAATSNITVNFTVAGSATLTTDYTVSGADTFTATTGTATIPNGSSSVAVTVTPVIDAIVEPTETVQLMIASGTGYDGGTPNSATGSITNDDTSASDPLIAVMGMSHAGPDGFSFVAAQDVPAGTVVYFTEDEFDNTTLLFSSGESVLQWTSPGGQIDQGDVITVTEGGTPDTFTVACSDTSGNTAQCSFNVIVNDVDPPTITCPGDFNLNNDAGICGAVVNYTVTGMDNCAGGGSPITLTFTGPDIAGSPYTEAGMVVTADPGQHIDAPWGVACGDTRGMLMHGNTSNTWVYNGGVVFTPQSVEICANPADFVFTSSTGATFTPATAGVVNFPATPDWTEISSMRWDNISGGDRSLDNFVFLPQTFSITQTAGLPSGSEFPVGTTTNTFVITDIGGNTATCSFDVTVNDVEAPVLTCPADITINNDPGNCSAAVTVPVPTIFENCPGTTTTTAGPVTAMQFSGGDLINTPSTITGLASTLLDVVLDIEYNGDFSSGSSSECFTLNGPDGTQIFQECGGGPTCAIINSSVTISATTWNNWISTFGTDLTFTLVGDAQVDQSQCSGAGSHEFQLTANTGFITLTNDFNGTSDASGTYPVGTTTVIWTAIDNAGNVGTCSMTVTVNDTEDPVINCPGDIIVSNDAGVCGATVTYSVTGSDNCPGENISQTAGISSGGLFPIGTTTNTFVITDASGNTATCSFDVTVNDTEPPAAICMDITLQLDVNGNASITASDVDGGSTDNCGIASLAVSPSTFDCSDVGPNTVTLTVTDVNGNSSTCTATVTVEDNVAPDAVCMDIDVILDATGNASITPIDVDGGSTDACGIASLAIDVTDFTCADVGPNDVTLTVTDVNGNTSSCIAVVTVIDDIPPVISCPADVVTGTDPGLCSAQVTFGDAIASDACGVTVVQTDGLPSGSAFPVGVSTIEFTATDGSGNTTVCSFTITVNDDEPAMAVCQDITIQLDDTGNATITAADVDGGSTDNCGIASTTIDIDTFDCSDVGDNPVVLTVTDDNGNVTTCTAIVTVEDVTAPDVVCMDITIDLDATGTVTILPTDIDGGSTDACGIATYELDIDTFDCSNVGDNTVTLTVTDVNGNSASCTAIVTVQDVTDPVLTCMDITVELDENGMAVITPEDVIDTVDDACGIETTAIDIFEFSCDDIGTPIVVQVFVQDVNGNLATCTATVTVVDALAPVLTCPEDQTVDPGPGNLFYEIPDYFATGEATAVDNCTDPVTITTQDPAPGTLVPDGTYTITMTAEDEYGNVATCEFELTVESVLGVDDLPVDLSTIVVYPNPATDVVFISNPQSIILEKVTLFDLVGRKVATYNLRDMGTETSLDISNLATASYTMVIEGSGGQINKRLIKE